MATRAHVATRKGLFTIEGTSAGWSIVRTGFLGDNCSAVTHDPRDGALYVALDHGHFGSKLHRSRDGGHTWQEIPAPKYPAPPDGWVGTPTMFGPAYEWNLRLIWTIVPGGASEPGVLWCGTSPGGLFRSDDGGDSWSLNRPLWDEPGREAWVGGGADQPGLHSICVDPRDPRHIAVAVSTGGVWRTRDGGLTWSLVGKGLRAAFAPPEQQFDQLFQDVHCLAACPARPDVMWVQHHNGIFRSTDGADTFSEITDVQPSVFGFPVAAHPTDPETAWFVPAIKDEKRYPADARVVVNRTRDGGRTFDTLSAGLPQVQAYDLVYRHALDVDDTGNRLVMGSTTGSLWVSEDGGDAWHTLSEHLPPVYAVRFEKRA